MPMTPEAQQLDMQVEEQERPTQANLMDDGVCEEIVLFPQFNEQYTIYINMLVWRQLWQYAGDNKDREIGGVLLGNVIEEPGSGLDIQAYLPGRYMEETLASLTFNHRTWNDIHQRHAREHSDKKIIGWFHTHPGHGIFLSRYDLYIHQSFFPRPGQIAVVFDPVHNSAGFFQRQEFQLRQLRRIHIYNRPGDAFDQNTRDFIATVGQHSQPGCQPTLSLPIQLNIPSGLERGGRHQGLAFLLRLMDIRQKNEEALPAEEIISSLISASTKPAADSTQEPSAPDTPAPNRTASSAESLERVQDDGSAPPGESGATSYLSSPTGGADYMPRQDAGLGLSARVWMSHPSGAGEMRGTGEPEALTPGIDSRIYAPLSPLAPGSGSGPDQSAPPAAKRAGAAPFLRMTREVDEARLDQIKKKLIPIKDQVARDLRQAEREILSPTGYKQAEYSVKKPYASDFDAESLNLML